MGNHQTFADRTTNEDLSRGHTPKPAASTPTSFENERANAPNPTAELQRGIGNARVGQAARSGELNQHISAWQSATGNLNGEQVSRHNSPPPDFLARDSFQTADESHQQLPTPVAPTSTSEPEIPDLGYSNLLDQTPPQERSIDAEESPEQLASSSDQEPVTSETETTEEENGAEEEAIIDDEVAEEESASEEDTVADEEDSEVEGEESPESDSEQEESERPSGGSVERDSGEDGAAEPPGGGDYALIDFELAEHERWAGSFGEMGTAGSDQRAQFLLDQAGQGATSGAVGGVGMGFVMGAIGAGVGQIAGRRLATLAVSRGFAATPVPGLGSAIGGVMAVAGLAMRDWGATADTIGKIGTGEGYEGLANDLEGLAEILDVATQVMDVLGGVLGGIAVGMWVGAVVSLGTLSPLAASLSAIALGINLATTAIGIIISVVIRPVVTALRALHTFESQGDPAQIEAEGQQLQGAAGQITGAIAGAVAGRAGGAAGGRGGRRADAAVTRWQARRTGGTPAMSAAAGPGPRVHVEVPEAPTRVDAGGGTPIRPLAADASSISTSRPASTEGPAASPTRPRRVSDETAPIRMDVLSDIAEHQRLSSGAPLGEPELGSLPGPLTRHLRRGERDPGNFQVPRAARSRLGKQARSAGMANLQEAVEGGIDTPRTAASREYLTSDQLVALSDPEFRRAHPEVARDVEQSVQASHVPGVATEPHRAHTGEGVEIIPTVAHLEGIHGGDTTRPLETAFPNPEYQGRPGFHPMGERARPSLRSDRGLIYGSQRESAHWQRRFPGASQRKIDEGRAWLAERQAELRASGASDFDTPPSPSAQSPHRRRTSEQRSAYQSHTETGRTTDRTEAMAQYHEQIRSDPGRESGVWRGEDGTYYVMQGDSGSVAPPAVSGRVELIYHSHPTETGAARQGMVSQPSQAGGDFGVLQYQHGQGTPGRRQSSELHFPTYDSAGAHTGYGATQFSYDPTHPLPLQVRTTLPGGRPTTQRYASHADFEARTGIRAGGATPGDSTATRVAADAQLGRDVAAAQARVDTIVGGTRTRPYGLPGMREGSEFWRQEVHDRTHADGGEALAEVDTNRPEYGPAYTVETGGLEPGESIEIPINPSYPEPPGSTAELAVLMERVHTTQEAQTRLGRTERAMATQADQQRIHETQLGEAEIVTQDIISGRTDHQAAVDSTESTNTEQQSTAGEVVDSLGRGAEEATALATLVGSLRVFQGLAHLFSYLPGSLGQEAERAKADSEELIISLDRVSDTETVESNVEEGRGVMEANAERIGSVSTEGEQTDEELNSGQEGIADLQQAHAESLAETESVQQQATRERRAAASSEEEAQTTHDDLQGQLQTWAQAHQQAREDAIQHAISRYRELGYQARED